MPVIEQLPLKSVISEKELLPIDIAEPEIIEFSEKMREYSTNYCGFDLSKIKRKSSTVSGVELQNNNNIKSDLNIKFQEKEGQCCVFNQCKPCCVGESCKTDPTTYPIIFVHGHAPHLFKNDLSYSISAFENIQNKLGNEGLVNEGVLLPDDLPTVPYGEWGKFGTPVMVRVTYYNGVYDRYGNPTGKRDDGQSINIYASRLGNLVDSMKKYTGKDKVTIIAHSMGGLVSRAYIKNKNGANNVYKLITIGTPNHGVYGNVKDFCGLLNLGTLQECREMEYDNQFIIDLNSDESYGDVGYYTITGTGCVLGDVDGDGIVRSTSVPLDGATNYKVNGKCSGITNRDFHSELLNPNKYPETLDFIKSIIQN